VRFSLRANEGLAFGIPSELDLYVERVTGIEPHYQLENLCRPGLSPCLTCEAGCP
jgi:hypothetical protein